MCHDEFLRRPSSILTVGNPMKTFLFRLFCLFAPLLFLGVGAALAQGANWASPNNGPWRTMSDGADNH